MGNNEGRDCPLSEVEREQLLASVKPQIEDIKRAIGQIEALIGTKESWARSIVITNVLMAVPSTFSNILCAAFGWAEQDKDQERVVFHSASSACEVFFKEDYDLELGRVLEEITKLVDTERYELVQKVQSERKGVA